MTDDLAAAQERWTAAARRVFADVRATTPLRWEGQIAVHEDEEVRPELESDGPAAPGGSTAYASVLTLSWGPQPAPQRRPLPRPELWLHVRGYAVQHLPDGEDDLERAVLHLLDDLQDRVIDELWTGWPACPGHGHPRRPRLRAGRAVWGCPAGGSDVAIGLLGNADT